jgi:hypothetical protein
MTFKTFLWSQLARRPFKKKYYIISHTFISQVYSRIQLAKDQTEGDWESLSLILATNLS